MKYTNQTMNLADCKAEWFFNEEYRCWCLEDILYTEKACVPAMQRLNIYVPAPYMKERGEITENVMNGYTARTAPVIFENNSSGYMEMPYTWLGGPRCLAEQYLKKGFVYISCGNRGCDSRDREGKLCGKSPANLIDLKTAIRFLRHNASYLPGNLERIISIGSSAGGAMSALLGVTGNHPDYAPYLAENGAFPEERDDVFAAQIYCPVTDLEHADAAYEWMFSSADSFEGGMFGPGGTLDAFSRALSERLKIAYAGYFNDLRLKDPESGELLTLSGKSEQSSGYRYLLKKLEESVTVYLTKLKKGELALPYSAEDYIAGNYNCTIPKIIPRRSHGSESHKDLTVGARRLLLRNHAMSAKDTEVEKAFGKGEPKEEWLQWDGKAASISSLEDYVRNYCHRLKPCTAFDKISLNSTENRVFGSRQADYLHFSRMTEKAVRSLQDAFPEECADYLKSCRFDEELNRKTTLYNPLNYIEAGCEKAKYFRLRVGSMDADTSLLISMTLALKLEKAGYPVDYRIVWEQPHCQADYSGELLHWIEKICPPNNPE